MNSIKNKWRRWFAIPLAVVLALAIVMPLQLNQEPTPSYASGVVADTVVLTSQDEANHTTLVQFNIGWDYSWRDVVNWDAAWVFVKYKVGGNPWEHATLATTGHTNPTGSTIDVGLTGGAGMGVFIYRDAAGTGSVSFTGVQLKWLYGTDGVADNALVVVKVFAIEMVYIPEGAFYVGDYDASPDNCFYEGGTTQPLQITSEGEITVADTAGNLYYDQDTSAADSGDRGSPIPAAFPKGYDAFYMMKYEVSQRQYAEFLNTLTSTQQTTRFMGNTGTDRQYIELQGGVYGADANNDNTLNGTADGEWVAANFTSWMDGAAYADWAGLRPYTELEFEKAARGTAAVVDDEYAWGTANITRGLALSYPAEAGEVVSTADANAVYGNSASGTAGPYRGGSLTDADDTREEAGASYYGVMELSGNLWEKTVTVGNATGRGFTGSHGDGSLSTNGNATNSDWPGYVTTEVTGATGSGFRAGAWSRTASELLLSDRTYGARDDSARVDYNGVRLARTAP